MKKNKNVEKIQRPIRRAKTKKKRLSKTICRKYDRRTKTKIKRLSKRIL